ncbi:MAG: Dabb family protein [Balneolaceae bacterium]|nr:Dabb family protein [Balneolaceae bacterium]MDR9409091.1 Dabb family protein [Balneolaceae bacterium]
MKDRFHFITVGIFLIAALFGFTQIKDATEYQSRVLRHVVFLDLNAQATDSIVKKMNQDLDELNENIPQIRELEFGTNIQEEADYSHCMFLTFESLEDLKSYEEHPMHLEFASTYGKYVVKKTELDYWY